MNDETKTGAVRKRLSQSAVCICHCMVGFLREPGMA